MERGSGHDARVQVVDAMVADRGWCMTSFASIEYLLGDLVWQAANLPAYSSVAVPFPVSADGRAKKVRELLEVAGPLDPYRQPLLEVLQQWETLQEGRLYFAHGHTAFFYTRDGAALMQFRRFVQPPRGSRGQPVTRDVLHVRPAELAEARRIWTELSQRATDLFLRIQTELGLERTDDLSPREAPIREG